MKLGTLTDLSKEKRLLVKEAERASEFAYAPYSNMKIGAAVLTWNGRIIAGSAFETASYHPINAVQSAIAGANALGHRKLAAVAIVAEEEPRSKEKDQLLKPTGRGFPSFGVERQVLVEAEVLSGNDIEVIYSISGGTFIVSFPLAKMLLPGAMTPQDKGIDIAKYAIDTSPVKLPFEDRLDTSMPQARLHGKLLDAASFAMENAYSPYSKFKVGVAALTVNGYVVVGANYETVAGDSIHGEQTTIARANSLGNRNITALAIICRGETFNTESTTAPCGNCRQSLLETEQLSGKPIQIIDSTTDRSKIAVFQSVAELLPHSFGPADIGIDLTKYRR